jgi:hypothetical protein
MIGMTGDAGAGPKMSGGTFDVGPLPMPVIDTSRLPGAPPATPAPIPTPTMAIPPPLRPLAPTRPAVAPAPMVAQPPMPAAPAAPGFTPVPLYGLISELRGGALAHAFGPSVADSRRESGVDVNLEILFASPPLRFFWYLFEPRPTLGVDVSTSGQTTFGYGGLTWEWNITQRIYADFFLGIAGHDGYLHNAPRDRRELGSRWLFREALELGWRISDRHAVSLMIDHYSNAGYLDKKNQGNDNFGARYSYRY